MSQTKKRFFVSYVVLVGLPLLGLVGVLKSGRNLKAPIPVGGIWELQADSSAAEAPSCTAWLGFQRPITLEISQSGRNLAMTLHTLPKVSLQATLDGTELATDVTSPASSKVEVGCIGAEGLSLRGRVSPNADPQVISGTLSISGCPSCESISFGAIRQTLAAGDRSE